MDIKFKCFVIFLFSIANSLVAQNSNALLCRVLDAETKYPVSYATIQFTEVNNGVIADENGGFRLPAAYKNLNQTIQISSIGYETLQLKTGALSSSIVNEVYLKPRVETLDAVVIEARKSNQVNRESVENIVRNAIGRIPTNYPRTSHAYIGYYRDYQIVNDNYYNLNEAILEDFDSGFDTDKLRYKDNKTALYSYNLNKEFYQDTLLLNSIYGKSKVLDSHDDAKLGTDIQNELEILNIHNPIRNYNKSSFSFIYVFKDDFINNHFFKLSRLVYKDDVPLYEITFASRESEFTKFKGEGKIFISKTNFAIYKLEYRVFENKNYSSRRSNDNTFTNISRLTGSTLFEVNIEYKSIDDKMYLSYMTFNNRFIIKEPNPFEVETFSFNPEDESFYIVFNKPVDENTIKRKNNFKLRYKNKKLIIKSLELVEPKTVRIKVISWSAGNSDTPSEAKAQDFSYKLKKIQDNLGGEIDKESKLLGYQFRELFTQEVFQEKRPTEDLIYVIKALPLSGTRVNSINFDIEKYWISTPLKQSEK